MPTRSCSPRLRGTPAADDDRCAGIRREHTVRRLDDDRLEEVHVADEVRHEGGRRPVVDLPRLAKLLDAAVRHDGDPVGHREGLALVVRHVDEGDPDLLLDPLQLDLHLLAELQVERAERLVEQQDTRIQDERAGQRDPLLLPARELRGPVQVAPGQLHELERLAGRRVALGLRLLPLLQAVRDVVEDRHVREQRVLLEDGVHVAPVGRDADRVLSADQHLADVGLLGAGDQLQRRRLAAAGRAEQRQELAVPDAQRDVVDGGEVAEPLRDRAKLDVVRAVARAGSGAASSSNSAG